MNCLHTEARICGQPKCKHCGHEMREGSIAPPCSSFVSPFGYTHPERDKREMCPFCYNEDTRRMVGLELTLYEEYHNGCQFKAFECESCRAKFHFSSHGPAQPPKVG